MSVLRITLIAGLVIYAGLWALVFNGATSLIAPLSIPIILAVMIALGVAVQRFIGLPPRKQHFRDRGDDSRP